MAAKHAHEPRMPRVQRAEISDREPRPRVGRANGTERQGAVGSPVGSEGCRAGDAPDAVHLGEAGADRAPGGRSRVGRGSRVGRWARAAAPPPRGSCGSRCTGRRRRARRRSRHRCCNTLEEILRSHQHPWGADAALGPGLEKARRRSPRSPNRAAAARAPGLPSRRRGPPRSDPAPAAWAIGTRQAATAPIQPDGAGAAIAALQPTLVPVSRGHRGERRQPAHRVDPSAVARPLTS
jgi:hypothetical protein